MITKEQIDKAFRTPEKFIYFGDLPIGTTWSLGPVIQHRDSDLLEQSNAKALKDALTEYPEWEDDWAIESMNHWAVGWVEHFCFKVVNEDGTPTEIFQFLLSWKERLEAYPLADEDLYSEMVMDATMENIRWIGEGFLKEDSPKEWTSLVYDWFWEYNLEALENRDDQGAWPSREDMKEALKELGLLDEEE